MMARNSINSQSTTSQTRVIRSRWNGPLSGIFARLHIGYDVPSILSFWYFFIFCFRNELLDLCHRHIFTDAIVVSVNHAMANGPHTLCMCETETVWRVAGIIILNDMKETDHFSVTHTHTRAHCCAWSMNIAVSVAEHREIWVLIFQKEK